MTRSLPFAILSVAALVSGGMAVAQTPAPRATAATHATRTVTHTTTRPGMARSATTTRTTQQRTTAAGGRMVATKTTTGKSVTYNCAKAGNANKKACKR